MAAAAASLSTVMLSMSFGLMFPMPEMKILSKSPASIWLVVRSIVGMFFWSGTPSTTHSGSALPVRVFVPLIRTVAVAPGRPEVICTFTPASFPCSNWSILLSGLSFSSSAVTTPTAPVLFLNSTWEYPVTTTWSRLWASVSITTSYLGRETVISWVSKPMKLNLSLCPFRTVIL